MNDEIKEKMEEKPFEAEKKGNTSEKVVNLVKKGKELTFTPDEGFLLGRIIEMSYQGSNAKIKDVRLIHKFCKNLQKQFPKYEGEMGPNSQPKDQAAFSKYSREHHGIFMPDLDYSFALGKIKTYPNFPQSNDIRHVSMGIFKQFKLIDVTDEAEKYRVILDRMMVTLLYNAYNQRLQKQGAGYKTVIDADRKVKVLLDATRPDEGVEPQMDDKIVVGLSKPDYDYYKSIVANDTFPTNEQSRDSVIGLADAFEVE